MDASRAKELLHCAVQCDAAGRILEAQSLYEEGIDELMKFVRDEKDEGKRKAYMLRVKEYMERAEILRARVNGHMQQGAVEARIAIEEDETGHNYASLFGKYMNEKTHEILLEDTYLREKYQFHNLIRFLELAVGNCVNLKYIKVVTTESPKNPDQQRITLSQIRTDLKERGIRMEIKYDESLHDRKIVLSNGFIITIGRGLHFFKALNPLFSLGIGDYKFRKCLKTEITIFQTLKS